MDAAAVRPKVAKITIPTVLESKLAQIDRGLFAAADANTRNALNLKRKAMFEEIGATAYTRYHAGNAVREYHALYRRHGEKEWKEKAGPVVMEALGYKSLKSVYNLMHDARVARKLGGATCKALVDRGYDPASRKYASIANELLKLQKGRELASVETAVETAIRHYKEQKQQSKWTAADPETFKSRIAIRVAGQIVSFAKRAQAQEPIAIFDDMVQQARTLLVGKIAKSNSKTAARAEQSKRAPTAAIGIRGSAESAGAQQAKLSEPAKLTIIKPKPLRLRGPAHPWGDACLDCLRFLDKEPDGSRRVRFHRDLLYSIREDSSPKRFFLTDSPDIFDLEREDIIREYFSVFQDAKWHIFQLAVKNLERARAIKSAMMASRVHWPINLWIGTSIDCPEDLVRIKELAKLDHNTSWVSFANFRSNPRYPLAEEGLEKMLAPIRWLVGRADFDRSDPEFSVDDAGYLKQAFGEPCYFTQPQTKASFLSGADLAVPSTVVREAQIRELLETRSFPTQFYELQRPTDPKYFGPFEGPATEDVEIICDPAR